MSEGPKRIDLADFLLLAEAALGIDTARLRQVVKIGLAESALEAPYASFGGHIFYPDPVAQAGVLCSRIVRNHPLPDGNKRVAYLCMRAHLLEHDLDFQGTSQDDRAEAVENLASGDMAEEDFIAWLRVETKPD